MTVTSAYQAELAFSFHKRRHKRRSQSLATDSLISHYRIVSKIGAGGMGVVYLAHETKLDRKVAIKFLNQEFSKDVDKLNRFVQEAKPRQLSITRTF